MCTMIGNAVFTIQANLHSFLLSWISKSRWKTTATDPGQLIFHDLTFDNRNPGVSAESLVTHPTSLKLFASGSGFLKFCIQYLQQNFSFKYSQIPKFFQLLVGFAIFSLK